MIRAEEVSTRVHQQAEAGHGLAYPVRLSFPEEGDSARITALEQENGRLHRLVAELLIKNQQLRRAE